MRGLGYFFQISCMEIYIFFPLYVDSTDVDLAYIFIYIYFGTCLLFGVKWGLVSNFTPMFSILAMFSYSVTLN